VAKTGESFALKAASRLNAIAGPLTAVSMAGEYYRTGGIDFGELAGSRGEHVGVGKYTVQQQVGETQAGLLFVPAGLEETLITSGKLREGDYFGAMNIGKDDVYINLGRIINGKAVINDKFFYNPDKNAFIQKIDGHAPVMDSDGACVNYCPA
jgi:hypothetical protein